MSDEDITKPEELDESEGVDSGEETLETEPVEQEENTGSQPDELLDQAQADLEAALAPEVRGVSPIPQELGNPDQYSFESFDGSHAVDQPSIGLEALKEVDLDLRVELGKAELLVDEVLQLVKGSVVPLDKLAGDPVDVIVNDNLVARGEVLVLNGNFCVRIAEILSPDS